VGPDRRTHLRNIAILVLLAVAVWQLPGGDRAATTVANVLSLIFIGGLLFLGFRLYMENRGTLFGLEERQRGVLYAGAALIAITLVATRRMWEAGGIGAIVWLMMLGAGVYAIVGVWRAYREY
jgi:hypothetical protein